MSFRHVAIAADLIDPGRVNLIERWESQAAVETFRSSGPSNEQGAAMLSASVAEYDIADVRPLFGKAQHETCSTDRATTDEIGAAWSDRNDETKPTREKGTATMKLTTTTFVSVDGVMQGIGSPDEDRSGGFERGGWTTPLWDNEAGTFLNEVYGRADAFLFGRRTYEIFAGSGGAVADPGINPIAAALNSRPKYVASTTLTNPQWADTTVFL
jgi:hypothetical protein